MKILITGVGGPSPRSFAIALKRHSFYKRYQIIGTDNNPLAHGLYNDALFNQSYVVPLAAEPDYWEVINKIIEKHQISYAIVLPEREVLEWSRKSIEGNLPCESLLPDYELAKILVDKARMTDILEPLEVVPASVPFTPNNFDYDKIRNILGPEFWVRATVGTSGLGSLRVTSGESLRNWVRINPAVKQYLASKFLPGRNLACKLLYYKGALVRSACGERVNYIMSNVSPSGVTGNTSFGRLLNEPILTELSSRAMDRLFESIGAEKHGFFTVDLKEDENGQPFITEVNVRHVAFSQCFAAAGANFAEDTIRLLSNDESFNREYKYYFFDDDLIFLRDVDEKPIIMKETQIKKQLSSHSDL